MYTSIRSGMFLCACAINPLKSCHTAVLVTHVLRSCVGFTDSLQARESNETLFGSSSLSFPKPIHPSDFTFDPARVEYILKGKQKGK